MESTVCRGCNSREFAVENSEQVCINCGDVQEQLVDESNLCSIPDRQTVLDNQRNKEYEASHRLTGRIRGEANTSAVKRQIGREKLLVEMRRVVKQIIKHTSAVDETMELVRAAIKAHKGRLLNSKKLGLVGACIYYLSAKHQLGITLADISRALSIRMKVMSVCLKQVKELCPGFEYERSNMKDLVKKYVDEMTTRSYDPACLDPVSSGENVNLPVKAAEERIPLIDNKDRVVLQDRVMLLLDIFEAMHPYNQPSPQSLIVAVIYHAWRSLDTFKMIAVNLNSEMRQLSKPEDQVVSGTMVDQSQKNSVEMRSKHSVSYEKFCQICRFKYSSNGHKIVSKLQCSLLALGRHIGDVNKLNLPWFLKDIIENSSHLIQEHMRLEA